MKIGDKVRAGSRVGRIVSWDTDDDPVVLLGDDEGIAFDRSDVTIIPFDVGDEIMVPAKVLSVYDHSYSVEVQCEHITGRRFSVPRTPKKLLDILQGLSEEEKGELRELLKVR